MSSSISTAKAEVVEDDAFGPVMIAIFFGAFVAVLNTSTINIAIPSLIVDFNSTIGTIQWTLTGFMLATGLSAPISGYLGDRFGQRNLYVYVLIGLGLASILCALAWNPLSLIIFRVIQGFFCGVIMPVTMTIIYQVFSSEKHAFAISLWSIAGWMGPAFGPTMAGLILQYLSWPWLFIVNVPLVVISIILAIRLIPDQRHTTKPSLDISGLILVLYCSFALLIAFSEASHWGWVSWQTLFFLVTGTIILCLFMCRSFHKENPLLNVRVLQERQFTISIIINCIISASLFAGVYMVPIFMQTIQQVSPLKTGLVLLPASLIMVVVMPLVGKLYHRIGTFSLTMFGLLIIAYSQWKLNLLTLDASSSYILVWMMVRNIGIAFASVTVTNAGMEVISKKMYGHASAMNNWTRQVVSSLAIGLFTTLYAVRQSHHFSIMSDQNPSNTNNDLLAMAEGVNDVFLASTIVILLSIPLVFGLRQQKKPTM